MIGQTLRFGDPVLTATLQTRMPAAIGGFGALHDACKRVIFSLRDWGALSMANVATNTSAVGRHCI